MTFFTFSALQFTSIVKTPWSHWYQTKSAFKKKVSFQIQQEELLF